MFSFGIRILGVGCSSDEPGNGGLCMYGTPIGSFKIKGKVTSEDGKAVAGATMKPISVFISENSSGSYDFIRL